MLERRDWCGSGRARQRREPCRRVGNAHRTALSAPALPRWLGPLDRLPAARDSHFWPRMFYDAVRLVTRPDRICRARRDDAEEGRANMRRSLAAGIFLTLATSMPAHEAAAQDPVAGAIVGGALGGIIGGSVGRGAGGAVAGAVIGAAAGAAIASEGQRRASGYYWWH